MRLSRLAPICFSLVFLTTCPALGQDGVSLTPALGANAATNPAHALDARDIVVTGEREKEAEAVRGLTVEITRKPRIDKPLSRFYKSVCLEVIGFKREYAARVADRIEANARELGIPVGGSNCKPNALLIFTDDGRETVEMLHDEEPWLFAGLFDREYERLLAGNGAVHAWQTTELRGVDGRGLRIMELDICGNRPCDIKRDVTVNDQYQTGRLKQPIRMDMMGAVVLIDNAYLSGKTLSQLADYATMRLLSPTYEASAAEADTVPTILSLFTAPESAPLELTRFDRSYLGALYALRPNAKALSIRDATLRAFFRDED